MTEDQLATLDGPVGPFAARSLDTLGRKLQKRGRHFRSLTPEARHRLRIAIKHMRYATEFFGALFDAEAARSFVKRASALQDALGALNDAAIALRLVKDPRLARDAELAHATGIVTGWFARDGEGDPEALEKDWRRLVKAANDWRDDYGKPVASA